ncbi:MAG: NFACT RNA binding domain-containing protein [Desulfovibrio sp.]|uniref:NFACT RNA binding domain-containing protein n=1 Tax=Desulfovibrio sp. 7SRBS1 TaxID=3378064 RepID=UPI003B3C6D5A
MEANFFRALAPEIAHDLAQARIGKVYSPEEGIWTFALNKPGRRPFLLFRPAKNDGLLFVSERKPENPAMASAHAMWYRKRLSGRFVCGYAVDWPGLRLALELSPGPGRYLIFSLREGLRLADELEPEFGVEPEWPAPEEALDNPEIWRKYPQISPPLRKILRGLPRAAGLALFASLQNPSTGFYLGYRNDPEEPLLPSAWPVPGFSGRMEYFESALKAAAAAGEPRLYPLLARLEARERTDAQKAQRKKLRRSLALIAKDQDRLRGLCNLQRQAEALQSQMYLFANAPLPRTVRLTHPDGEELEVCLDPRLSLSGNLEMLFRKAAKGERGLKIVAQREQLLRNELGRLLGGGNVAQPDGENGVSGAEQNSNPDIPVIPKKYEKLAVRLFRSSDGFLMVRGRNAKANHQLLSFAASPFDYWFHAKDVPGAHVVLRRDHPRQEVPEESMREAAILAALSSKASASPRAEVICAKVKDVRKIKGAHLGMVRVDTVDRVLYVDVDSSLEDNLAYSGS